MTPIETKDSNGDHEKPISARGTDRRRRRGTRLAGIGLIGLALIVLAASAARYGLPFTDESDTAELVELATAGVDDEDLARVELMGGVARVDTGDGQVVVRLGLRRGDGAREARVVLVDDRSSIIDQTEWLAPGQAAALPVDEGLLEVGPIRARLDVRSHRAAMTRRAWLLVGEEPEPADARTVYRLDAGRKVGLVFDDGLDGESMARITRTLREARASGTFCLNGYTRANWDASLRSRLITAANDGVVELCSHGYSHRTGTKTGPEAARRDIARNREVLDDTFGTAFRPLYRPPRGELNGALREAAGELGYKHIVMWDVDPGDLLDSSPETIATRVARDARPGSIVVLHLIPATADALPRMIAKLRANGLEPMGVGRMLRAEQRIAAEKGPDGQETASKIRSAALRPVS